MPINTPITLAPDAGGRLEYGVDEGGVLAVEKSQMLYMMHRAMVNFQQNNRDTKLNLTVIANRNQHNCFNYAEWTDIKKKCLDCEKLRLDEEKDTDICEKHQQVQLVIEPSTLPGAPVLG